MQQYPPLRYMQVFWQLFFHNGDNLTFTRQNGWVLCFFGEGDRGKGWKRGKGFESVKGERWKSVKVLKV